MPLVRGHRGHPRRRPSELYADRAYDYSSYRRKLRQRRTRPVIARRGQAHGSGLGRVRWVIERSLGRLHWPRRLRVRWERRADIHESFLQLGTCLLQYRSVQKFC